jgi:hypothetical protein
MSNFISLGDVDLDAAGEELVTVMYHLERLRECVQGTEIEKYVVKEVANLKKIADFYFRD